MAASALKKNNSVLENDDMPEVPGGGQVDYLIELFQAQKQLWCDRSLLHNKMKRRRGAVYTGNGSSRCLVWLRYYSEA